jgi:acyl carrier protein/NAD(P)-dependent dehydrogenase (short-subunit alcohol dehydrogenase family)/pimeloyl-ACP methyl ester carboxylesterase
MKHALDIAREKFGTINGVIHAAGIIRDELIQAKKMEVADSVLAPKVYGTLVLFELLKDARLDFLVLFSSTASVLAPPGQADYSAANSFLDAFAHFANTTTAFHTITINWPGWKEVGILANLEVRPGMEGWKEAALQKAIRTTDGLEVFNRVLNSDLAQVVVSPDDLNRLIQESHSLLESTANATLGKTGAKIAEPRRSAQSEADQPTNEIETAVAAIWSHVFGIEQLGIHDNFSQLGGHSLLAMQIVGKIRSSYNVKLSLMEFFESPTIAQLSAVIRARVGSENGDPAVPALRSHLSPMGQRFFSASRVQKALYFGKGDARIFAIHHPPGDGGGGEVLTVICPPLFNEYMRTHLALRELAITLAEKGQHVLRFDYRGTGDSASDLDKVTVSDWLEDISLAVCEGRALCSASDVRLLGVRGSALLVVRSTSAHGNVQRIVLWDPVVSGTEFLDALHRIQRRMTVQDPSREEREARESTYDYGGYRLSKRMVQEFHALDQAEFRSVPEGKLRIVSSSEADVQLRGVPHDIARFACNWETDPENLMMPKPVLECLGRCLTMP